MDTVTFEVPTFNAIFLALSVFWCLTMMVAFGVGKEAGYDEGYDEGREDEREGSRDGDRRRA